MRSNRMPPAGTGKIAAIWVSLSSVPELGPDHIGPDHIGPDHIGPDHIGSVQPSTMSLQSRSA